MWAFLTILSALGLVALHFWWRARYALVLERLRRESVRFAEQEKDAEARSRAERDALFESMIEGVLVLDQAGRVQLANHAFSGLFGVGGELRGRTLVEIARIPELAEIVDRIRREGGVRACDLRLPGLEQRWLQVNGVALAPGDGRGGGVIVVFHDLTRLRRLERTRQEFVANVSHELRTPLSLIRGYAETLLDGAHRDPELARKFLDTIDRNARRLERLIDDLLTISELESAHMKLEFHEVDLHPLAERVIGDFASVAAAGKAVLVNEMPQATVMADEGRLEQVLGNLVDNAVKYGGEGVRVVLSGRVLDAQWLELCVADTGPGIPAESLERVFERFYRADKARSRERGGTGLGLAIVKHIVQAHGGRVWARKGPEKGAAILFTLPAGSPPPA